MAVLVAVVALAGCRAPGPNAAGGGAIGGLTGGLFGAAIGATEGKAPEGALIGAVTGAAAGTIAGNAIDRADERARIEQQQYVAAQLSHAITVDEVIRMTQSGLAPDVISQQVLSQGIANKPSIDELILLKNQGVPDSVIQALQRAPLAGQFPASQAGYVQPVAPVIVAPAPRPVIVDPWPGFYRFPPHRRHGGPRSGFSFSYGF